jgi:hypothetical protein
MRVRSFLVLCLVTTAAVAGAVALTARQEAPVVVTGAGDRLLPQLLDDANRIDQIRIVSGDKTVTLDRSEAAAAAGSSGWAIAERNGYPASFEKIKSLVVGLAQLKRVDAKTGRPERYAQIGVEDPGPGAQSTEITVSDAAGQPLARVILGKESFAGGDGRYVRIPGEAHAWQVSGTIEAEADARAWADAQVIDVPGSQIQSVWVRRPDGGTITAVRPDPDTREFVLRDVPAGRRQAHGGTADALGETLANVELEDVLPIDSVAFPRPETTRVRFETFDGLVLDIDLVNRDGGTWMRMTPDTTDQASADVKARATEIARRTDGWAYRVAEWRFSPLQKPLDDWLEPDKPS